MNAPEALHHCGRQRGEGRQLSVHAGDQADDAQKIRLAPALRAIAQLLAALLLFLLVEGLNEQFGVPDHAFAHRAGGRGVVFKPTIELARGDGSLTQCPQQLLAILDTGARQWCDHTHCCPARQLAGAHCGKCLLGKRRDQFETPVHPTVIAPAATCDFQL